MHESPFISRVSHAITVAGKWALIFAAALFLFLATILMTRGDGTAPAVTHFAVATIVFTVELLGLPTGGSLYGVWVFWSLVAFAISFLIALIFSRDESIPEDQAAWLWALGIVVIVTGAVAFLVRVHEPREESFDQRALAVEFVRNNADVMQAVGGSGDVELVGYSQIRNEPAIFEAVVYGTKTLYVFVEASGGSAAPKFRLMCTTLLPYSQRDASKPPCSRTE